MKLISSMIILSCALLAHSSHAETRIPMNATVRASQKINLNQASAAELVHAIKGIGKKRALAIVQYRQKHGPFRTITDLGRIRGMGLRFVQSHRSELDAKFIC